MRPLRVQTDIFVFLAGSTHVCACAADLCVHCLGRPTLPCGRMIHRQCVTAMRRRACSRRSACSADENYEQCYRGMGQTMLKVTSSKLDLDDKKRALGQVFLFYSSIIAATSSRTIMLVVNLDVSLARFHPVCLYNETRRAALARCFSRNKPLVRKGVAELRSLPQK